jgi:hypothetical protein
MKTSFRRLVVSEHCGNAAGESNYFVYGAPPLRTVSTRIALGAS